jgi:hypothetical protein
MFDVRFTSTIPSGSSTCHFDMFAREEEGDEWNGYSDSLRRRALKVVDVTNRSPDQ